MLSLFRLRSEDVEFGKKSHHFGDGVEQSFGRRPPRRRETCVVRRTRNGSAVFDERCDGVLQFFSGGIDLTFKSRIFRVVEFFVEGHEEAVGQSGCKGSVVDNLLRLPVGHAVFAGLDRAANVVLSPLEEGLEVDALVAKVSNGLHAVGVLFPKIFKVFVGGFVLGVVDLDGARVDELRRQILNSRTEMLKRIGSLLVASARVGDDSRSFADFRRKSFQVLASLVDQVSPVFAGVDDVAELLEGSRDVRHVEDDPVDGGVLDPLPEFY